MRLILTFILLLGHYFVFSQVKINNKDAVIDKDVLNEHKQFQGLKVSMFSLQDTSNSFVRLDSIKGKTFLFHFWYTHCPPCLADVPYFKKVVDFYKDSSSVQIISICVDKGINKKVWRKMIQRDSLKECHVFLDLDKPVSQRHEFYRNINTYPTYMIVDSTYKSLGGLINVDFFQGFIYEIEQARKGYFTSKSFMEIMKVEKQFSDWINTNEKVLLGL